MRNKYRVNIAITILLLLSACFLTGCQLAVPDELMDHKSERLCGAFVTIGLDSSRFYEEQLKNTKFNVNRKGELEVQTMGPASMTMEGTLLDGRVTFGEYQGYYIGEGEIIDNNGKKQPVNYADPGFYDVKCAYFDKEDGKESSYEGTLSVSRKSLQTINVNPVYRRADGSIYAVRGQGMSFNNSSVTGSSFSQTLDNKTSTSDGRTINSEKISFKVNITFVDEAKQVIIKEMDQNDNLIKATEYYPNSPDEYVVDPNTFYIVVEERNDNKKSNITRFIYNLENIDLEENYISHVCHFPGKDSVIGVKSVHFVSNIKSGKK